MKRFLAVVLVLCLVLGMGSVSAFAATQEFNWKTESTYEGIKHGGGIVANVNKEIFLIGGAEGGKVDIYNTETGIWRKGTDMLAGTYAMAGAAYEDKIYIFSGVSCGKLQIYDVKTDSWQYGTDVPSATYGSMASIVDNRIYVIGGRGSAKMRIYNVASDTWEEGVDIPVGIDRGMSVAVGNKIYVIGGLTASMNITNIVQIYDVDKREWSQGAVLPYATGFGQIVAINGVIYIIGGQSGVSGGYVLEVQKYNVETNTWEMGTLLNEEKTAGGAVVVDGKIYLVGGYTNKIDSLQVGSAVNLSLLLSESETVQLSTSYNLANNTNFTWTSADEAIATVDANGKVTAVSVGETEITVQNVDATYKESIPVKVLEMADEQRLAVHLRAAEKAKLYVTEDPSTVTWKSFDESVATVDATGQITGVAKGLAIVQAELEGETYQVYVRVNG